MTLYQILAQCPLCGAAVLHAEETDGPVDLMQDVPISANYCSRCGEKPHKAGGWDVMESSR